MENPSRFSPKNPHFFQPLLPGFKSHIKIPVEFFSKHIEGKHEGKTVRLRTDSSERTWNVKMEGHRLTNGWNMFVEEHDLRTGDFVVFRHEGDMLFHVTVLGPSCCEIQYVPSRSRDEEEEEESDDIGESSRLELIRGGASPLLTVVSEIEQSPFEAEAQPQKRARVQSRSKHSLADEEVADVVRAPTRRSKRAASTSYRPSKNLRSVPTEPSGSGRNKSKTRFVSPREDEVPPTNPLPNLSLDPSLSPPTSSSPMDEQSSPSMADTTSVFSSPLVSLSDNTEDVANTDLVIPATPPFSERFVTEAASDRYSILSSRGFIDMRVLPLDSSPTLSAQEIITQANLLSTVTLIGTYVEQVVKEFYANLEGRHNNVYIRGKMFEFTPELINQVLNLPEVRYADKSPIVPAPLEDLMGEAVKLVSGGSVRRWKDLASKHLTPVMDVLYKICCFNWLPTTNKTALKKERVVLLQMISKLTPLNMGKLIFDQINLNAKQCCTTKGTFRLMYPNLIYLILQFQRPVPQLPGDVISSKPKPVTLDPKKSLASTSAFDTDIAQIMQLLNRMQQRVARGEYGQGGGNQNEDKEETLDGSDNAWLGSLR